LFSSYGLRTELILDKLWMTGFYRVPVRTTLNIDPGVLKKAKRIAKANRSSVGRVLSDLLRQSLQADPATALLLRRSQNR
jgi:hypothetical protein